MALKACVEVWDGLREEVPSFWDAFNVRVVNLRLPMACCGCFGTAHLPPVCFALEAFRQWLRGFKL